MVSIKTNAKFGAIEHPNSPVYNFIGENKYQVQLWKRFYNIFVQIVKTFMNST